MRYAITLSYSGANYCGWQIQNNAPTVQGEVEKALSLLLREQISVTGAGRTDTGVNAINYVAHFDTGHLIINNTQELSAMHLPQGDAPIEAKFILYKLNAIVGKGIVFHSIEICPPDFHARYSAVKRTYNYLVHKKKDPFIENISLYCGHDLDLGKMNTAASYLIGEQDFSCFEKTGADNRTSRCNVVSAAWSPYTPAHAAMAGMAGGEDYIRFEISADRFLRNMVRAIVGTLLDIGRGKHGPEWIPRLIKSGDRCLAGQSVPGHALFLTKIEY